MREKYDKRYCEHDVMYKEKEGRSPSFVYIESYGRYYGRIIEVSSNEDRRMTFTSV